MQPHEERFLKELTELEDRTTKLRNLVDRYSKNELDFTPSCTLEELEKQLFHMEKYLECLQNRKAAGKL